MTKITLIFLALSMCILTILHGQDDIEFRVDCDPGQSQTELNINNVRASLLQSGSMFDLNSAGYTVPNDGENEASAIYTAGIWIGSIQNNNFKTATCAYDLADGKTDWFPGPLDEDGWINEAVCSAWDVHFEVLGSDITAFIELFRDQGGMVVSVDDVPSSLLGWPGEGNPYFFSARGYPLPDNSGELAPYFDRNLDGIYDPTNGDYPILGIGDAGEQNYADQMVFSIMNDNGNSHGESSGLPLRVEVHTLSFSYHTDDAINDMTFHKFTIFNKSLSIIDSMYFGLFMDPDLGCAEDDYVGCSPEHNLAYVYNKDGIDGTDDCVCEQNNVASYCTDVPMLGVDVLDAGLSELRMVYDSVMCTQCTIPNSGLVRIFNCRPDTDTTVICDVEYQENIGMSSFMNMWYNLEEAQAMPFGDNQIYNYLSGSWRDGTWLTNGGSGFDPGSTDRTSYAYPDPPDFDQGWSMCTEDPGDSDPRWLQSVGHFTMEPGHRRDIVMGIYFVPDIGDYPCPSLNPLFEVENEAQDFYNSGFDRSFLVATESPNLLTGQLYPNPTSGLVHFKVEELDHVDFMVRIYDLQGRLLLDQQYLPSDHHQVDLNNFLPGTYIIEVVSNDGIWTDKLIKY